MVDLAVGATQVGLVEEKRPPVQHWVVIEDTTGRFFMLQNRASGMCLVMRASENNARQVPCNSGDRRARSGTHHSLRERPVERTRLNATADPARP